MCALCITFGLSGLFLKDNKTIPTTYNSAIAVDDLPTLNSKLETEKTKLENEKARLQAQGVVYNRFANYTDGDEYTLKVIVNVLDPSFAYWKFDEYKNNPLTAEYCSLKQQIEDYDGNQLNDNSIAEGRGSLNATATTIPRQNTKKIASIFTSIAITFLVIFISTTTIFFIIAAKKKPKTKIGNTNVAETKQDKEITHEGKLKECIFCGSLAKIDATECESCGGKKFKKHKH